MVVDGSAVYSVNGMPLEVDDSSVVFPLAMDTEGIMFAVSRGRVGCAIGGSSI